MKTVPSLLDGPFSLKEYGDLSNADLLIVDDYSKAAAEEAQLRHHAKIIMTIDDLANREHICDILLDPTLGRQIEDYENKTPADCRFLLGADFSLLRPEFRRKRKQVKTRETIDQILIAPGQTDPHDLASLALNAIKAARPDIKIDIVLGSSAPHLEKLANEAQNFATIHKNIDANSIAELMIEADLAIGAAGGSGWERCALGLPSLVVVIADNQQTNAAALANAGAARVVGALESLNVDTLSHAITMLDQHPDELAAMSRRAASLCDGRGTIRAALALVPPQTTREGATIRLRAVEKTDVKTLFDWQVNPETRRYARNPTPPSWDEHVNWLDTKLNNDDCLFAIVEHNQQPAGAIRLDRNKTDFEISIVIAPNKRQIGIGTSALALARDLVPTSNILAYVKPDNVASLRLFKAVEYVSSGDNYYLQRPRYA